MFQKFLKNQKNDQWKEDKKDTQELKRLQNKIKTLYELRVPTPEQMALINGLHKQYEQRAAAILEKYMERYRKERVVLMNEFMVKEAEILEGKSEFLKSNLNK